MTRRITEEGHPTTAVGEHGGRPFRLVASYDGREDAYQVHVYIGTENEAEADQRVSYLKWFPSLEDALEAGEEAAMAKIGGT